MCLTTEFLALFLNMITPQNVVMEPGRIIVQADVRDAHWVEMASEDKWCTMAPHIDAMDRLASYND